MIKHSAMPQRCRKSLTPQELGELAFRSLVALLEEHVYGLDGGHRAISREDWLSLLKAVEK